jgi:hypothetical protein
MVALVEHELGPGAARRPAPEGPGLVAHVLASNVPALALPAIALGCLAGAAVLVKSGRDDPYSATAFADALEAVDPELAATVVATYWPGGDRAREEVVLEAADLVVVTGGETAVAALARRVRGRLVVHGPRVSVAAVGAAALDDPALTTRIAEDVALHDQRGCLSPQAVFVEAGGPVGAPALARRLAGALDALAAALPPARPGIEARAAARLERAEVEWRTNAFAIDGPGGGVLYDEDVHLRPTAGGRTVRVHPIPALAALPAALPAGTVECVGLAGGDADALAPALRALGVSRICPVGRMQRPPLAWPRGQAAPLGVLLGHRGERQLAIET